MNKQYRHTFFLCGLLFLITCGFSTQVMAQAPEINPQLIKVSKKRISRTVYEFTFKATLSNHDVPIKNVSATITSTSPHTVIMSDNKVTFNDVAANETVTSEDTFTMRQDRKFLLNPLDIGIFSMNRIFQRNWMYQADLLIAQPMIYAKERKQILAPLFDLARKKIMRISRQWYTKPSSPIQA